MHLWRPQTPRKKSIQWALPWTALSRRVLLCPSHPTRDCLAWGPCKWFFCPCAGRPSSRAPKQNRTWLKECPSRASEWCTSGCSYPPYTGLLRRNNCFLGTRSRSPRSRGVCKETKCLFQSPVCPSTLRVVQSLPCGTSWSRLGRLTPSLDTGKPSPRPPGPIFVELRSLESSFFRGQMKAWVLAIIILILVLESFFRFLVCLEELTLSRWGRKENWQIPYHIEWFDYTILCWVEI